MDIPLTDLDPEEEEDAAEADAPTQKDESYCLLPSCRELTTEEVLAADQVI
jgi:hypothetical protein